LVSKDLLDKLISAYRDEVESSIIYNLLAEKLRGKRVSRVLKEISSMEARHASFWACVLRDFSVDISSFKPRWWRIKFYLLFYRLFGFGLTLKLLERGENEAIKLYSEIIDSGILERGKIEVLKNIIVDELMHEEEFLDEESRISEFLDHVRDSVLGMNDGLVEILSVSTGLVAAYNDPLYVALGGLIVGFAGALSMAIGSYISVKSQKEVRLSSRYRFLNLVKFVPGAIHGLVSKMFRERGFSDEVSSSIAREVVEKKISVKEIIESEKIEDPVKSGIYTGIFYLVGAFIPLTPYFLKLPINYALVSSIILASIMLGLTGFIIALTAGLNIKRKIIEMITTGLGAATLTYIIGYIAKTLLGIEVE